MWGYSVLPALFPPLNVARELRYGALFEGHNGLLPAGRIAAPPAGPLLLGVDVDHVDRGHLHLVRGEPLLDGLLDQRLVRVTGDLQRILIEAGPLRRLFGARRP